MRDVLGGTGADASDATGDMQEFKALSNVHGTSILG